MGGWNNCATAFSPFPGNRSLVTAPCKVSMRIKTLGLSHAPQQAKVSTTLLLIFQWQWSFAEKAALRQENIMVVLGCLHATLKGLWAFKVRDQGHLCPLRVWPEGGAVWG